MANPENIIDEFNVMQSLKSASQKTYKTNEWSLNFKKASLLKIFP